MLLAAETAARWPAPSLTPNLETAVPGFSFVCCLGMLAWLKSSSQDPMVAARLASLPLRPRTISEDVVGATAFITSVCHFNGDWEVASEIASELPKMKEVNMFHWQLLFVQQLNHEASTGPGQLPAAE